MQSKLKPKPSSPDGTPGSGSGIIRFADLPLGIQHRATRIRSQYPMLTLQQAVIAALEQHRALNQRKTLRAKRRMMRP